MDQHQKVVARRGSTKKTLVFYTADVVMKMMMMMKMRQISPHVKKGKCWQKIVKFRNNFTNGSLNAKEMKDFTSTLFRFQYADAKIRKCFLRF